jgi:peptide deformylase
LRPIPNCFIEDNHLINKKLKEVTVEEGLEIAKELLEIMATRKDAIGLAANQVGIDARVAVVNVREPLILINPEITEEFDEITFYEGCLSFPKKGVYTKRYRNVVVKTAQEESGWYFSGNEQSHDGKGSWEKSKVDKDNELRLLEAVAVQHEIDHLNGITIHDNATPLQPIIAEKKPGRNEKCPCGSGKKYKKCCLNKPKATDHQDRHWQDIEYEGARNAPLEEGGWATSNTQNE